MGDLADERPLGNGALRRRRARRAALIALGVLVFIAISAWLARFLSTENAERNALVSVLQAQVAGNAEEMLDHLHGCRAESSCVATVRHDAESERSTGAVQILALTSPTAYSLTSASGETRIAWRAGARGPVVQCVLVRRRGSPLTGLDVDLVRISAPIGNEADCP